MWYRVVQCGIMRLGAARCGVMYVVSMGQGSAWLAMACIWYARHGKCGMCTWHIHMDIACMCARGVCTRRVHVACARAHRSRLAHEPLAMPEGWRGVLAAMRVVLAQPAARRGQARLLNEHLHPVAR